MVGAAGIAAGAAGTDGMVTVSDAFDQRRLPTVDDLVFGGQDVVTTSLVKRAEQLAQGGVLPAPLLTAVADRLDAIDPRIRTVPAAGETSPREAVQAMRDDLAAFRSEHDLDRLVVINLASTEIVPAWPTAPTEPTDLDRLLDGGWDLATPSLVAAIAALDSGAAFVDFTPGAALTAPAVSALATERGLPVAGRDGKTGETLLKAVLAPMFAHRNLRVHSWAGTNLLGGGDGSRLADPAHAASKLASKGRTLETILGPDVTAPVHIDHVPDLGEWKTAWNHVHFAGFLGTGMQLQLTWQGCDSTLAAPLVLDLARLLAVALERGDHGPQAGLGYFFKDPVGSDDHDFGSQLVALERWAARP